jgi:hypothetical protein
MQELVFKRVTHNQHLLQIASDTPVSLFLAVFDRHSTLVLQQIAKFLEQRGAG